MRIYRRTIYNCPRFPLLPSVRWFRPTSKQHIIIIKSPTPNRTQTYSLGGKVLVAVDTGALPPSHLKHYHHHQVPFTMSHHWSPRVSFSKERSCSRPADADELRVMYEFAQHVKEMCDDGCNDAQLTPTGGMSLCEKGHKLAYRLRQFLVQRDGRICSNREGNAYETVYVEIPAGYGTVRRVLTAFEEGQKRRRRKTMTTAFSSSATTTTSMKPIISYDEQYPPSVSRRTTEPLPRRTSRIEIVDPPRRYRDASEVIYLETDGDRVRYSRPATTMSTAAMPGYQRVIVSQPYRRRESVGVQYVSDYVYVKR